MQSAQTQSLVDQLGHAGITLSLTANGALAVSPASLLADDLRALIRAGKEGLINWVKAANDAASRAPDPPDNPLHWKEMAAAYHGHHFNCPICIAAGRGSQYGQRCGAGRALWRAYAD